MASRVLRGVLVGMAVISAVGARAKSVDAPTAVDASPTLAWRLDAISSLQLGPNQPSGAWRRSAALLEAAGRLYPAEPRFPRLRALAMLHLEDTDGAIAAVREYRKLVPGDRQAQSQLIDLYAGKMETVDAKLGYLRGLIDKEDLAAEVRSHIASQCAALLLQKSKPEAVEMAARAVELYPLAEASRQYYELAGREEPVEKRVAALLKVVEASPNDVSYLNEMGKVLSANGLVEQSIDWYGAALSVIIKSGPSRPEGFHNLLIDLASAQIIAGKSSEADNFLGQMLGELPLDPDAWFLKLTLIKSSSQAAAGGQILEMAKSALARRWNAVHDEILNGPAASQPAATRPAIGGASPINPSTSQPATTEQVKVEPLDAAAVIAKLKTADNADSKNAAIGTLSDLAWFELYYDNQPAAAKPWINAMAALGADEALMSRFNGWTALQSGQVPQAREILAKVSDNDALAALGLIRADEAEKKPIDQDAVRKLLTDHQSGLLGAVLWDGLRSLKVTPATQPSATAITAALAKFPKTWLKLWDPRTVRQVYEIKAEPVTTSVAIGDPLLFKVTVKNTSDHDIAIGVDSMLHGDLWLDGQILGMDRRQFRGVAFDRLGGELVLRPRGTTSQVVRIDVGELRTALGTYLGLSTRVGGDVITNPVVITGGAAPGPGGMYAGFDRTGVQVGVQIGTPSGRKLLDAELASASAVDRMHAADLIAACNRLASREAAAPELKKLAAELSGSLAKLQSDSSPVVTAWASYCLASSGPAAQGGAVAQEMSKSGEWTARLLSLVVGSSNQKELATALANDPDATVKSVAGATLEMLGAATSQPASQPVTQPSGAETGR